MKAKKVIALVMCAAMVAGMSASSVMAADMPEQFKDLKANEAYDFPMMVKSFQSTYWDAAQEGMKMAAEELGVTYTAQGPNSESDIADQVNMVSCILARVSLFSTLTVPTRTGWPFLWHSMTCWMTALYLPLMVL